MSVCHPNTRPTSQRIHAAKAKCQRKIASNVKPDRTADYEARIVEYDARLAEITGIWTAAPDDVRAAAHDRIAHHDATGMLRRDN